LFSELKILIKIKQEEQGTSEHEEATEKIIAELDAANLEGKSRATFEDLLLKWQKAKEQD
jgi:hypothetical protein